MSQASSIVVPREMFKEIALRLHELRSEILWKRDGVHATDMSKAAFKEFDEFIEAVALLAIDADIAEAKPFRTLMPDLIFAV